MSFLFSLLPPGRVLPFFPVFHDSDSFKERVQAFDFVGYPSSWVCPVLLHVQSQVMHSWQKYLRNDAMLFSVHHIKRPVMLTCPATGDVNLNHLVNLVSVRFFLL